MGIQRRVGIDVNLRLLLNNDSFLNRLLDDNGLLRFFYAQYPFVRFVKRFEFEAYAVVIGAGVFVVQVIGDFVAGRGNINRVGRNFVRFKAFVFLTGFFGTRVEKCRTLCTTLCITKENGRYQQTYSQNRAKNADSVNSVCITDEKLPKDTGRCRKIQLNCMAAA